MTVPTATAKSLCQPKDSDNFCFSDFRHFCPFCATFSDNLVTVERFVTFAYVSVTRSGSRLPEIQPEQLESCILRSEIWLSEGAPERKTANLVARRN